MASKGEELHVMILQELAEHVTLSFGLKVHFRAMQSKNPYKEEDQDRK